VNKIVRIASVLFVFALVFAPLAAFAQGDAEPAVDDAVVAATSSVDLTPLYGVSAGVVMVAAAFGIAKIGSSSVESMARQPEAAGRIQTAMIVSAALIEGVTFFALIVCMLK